MTGRLLREDPDKGLQCQRVCEGVKRVWGVHGGRVASGNPRNSHCGRGKSLPGLDSWTWRLYLEKRATEGSHQQHPNLTTRTLAGWMDTRVPQSSFPHTPSLPAVKWVPDALEGLEKVVQGGRDRWEMSSQTTLRL